jgi:hypothetical protein
VHQLGKTLIQKEPTKISEAVIMTRQFGPCYDTRDDEVLILEASSATRLWYDWDWSNL